MRREIHYGVVIDNVDPDKRGGLKVRVDTLLDQLPLLDEYIPPTFPFAGSEVGWFFVPEVGAQVEVEVETSDEQSVEDISASWRATLYSENDAPPAELTSDYPNRAGIKWGPVIWILDKTQDLIALVSSNVRLGEEAAPHPVMRGDTYNQQLDTYLTQEDVENTLDTTYLNGLLTALNVWANLTPPSGPVTNAVLTAFANAVIPGLTAYVSGLATFKAAIATFKGAAITWLSTKVKTE